MSDIAIKVENLSKLYRIGQRERYYTLRDRISNILTAPLRRLSTNKTNRTNQTNKTNSTNKTNVTNETNATKTTNQTILCPESCILYLVSSIQYQASSIQYQGSIQ